MISLGNPKAQASDLPGNPIVVPFAPHQKLIERSKVVAYADMNTVLTALGCGIPLVAIPITNEQPGIASRLARTKARDKKRHHSLWQTKLSVPRLWLSISFGKQAISKISSENLLARSGTSFTTTTSRYAWSHVDANPDHLFFTLYSIAQPSLAY